MKVKVIFGVVVLFCLWGLYACEYQNRFPINTPYVFIDADTLYVDIEGDLGGFVFQQDKYYAFFHKWEEKESILECVDYRLYILTKEGEILHEIPIPDSMKIPTDYWMYLKTDSILVAPDHRPFEPLYLDEKQLRWEVLHKVNIPFYEDENYVVTSSCSGEWGGTIYFTDKKTGEIYEGSSTCTLLVQKIDSAYYVTNYLGHAMGFSSIVKIQNPRNLLPYDTTRNLTGEIKQESISLQGIEVLLDTAFINMVTSFVHKGRFLHIYMDSQRIMQIGEIKGDSLKSVFSLQDIVGYCILQNIPSDTVQYLSFSTMDYGMTGYSELNKYGFMIVTPNKIQLHYLLKK